MSTVLNINGARLRSRDIPTSALHLGHFSMMSAVVIFEHELKSFAEMYKLNTLKPHREEKPGKEDQYDKWYSPYDTVYSVKKSSEII